MGRQQTDSRRHFCVQVTEEQNLPLPSVAELSKPVGYKGIEVVHGETPGCLSKTQLLRVGGTDRGVTQPMLAS